MLRDAKSLQLARALPWRRAFCNQQKIWRGPFVLALALARCPGVAMGLRWCCDDVVPLGSPCTSLVHAHGFRQPDGISTEPVPDSDSTGLAVIQMKFHEIQRAAHLLPSGGMGDFPDRQFGSKGRYLLSVVGPPTRNPTPIGPTAIASRLVDGR